MWQIRNESSCSRSLGLITAIGAGAYLFYRLANRRALAPEVAADDIQDEAEPTGFAGGSDIEMSSHIDESVYREQAHDLRRGNGAFDPDAEIDAMR